MPPTPIPDLLQDPPSPQAERVGLLTGAALGLTIAFFPQGAIAICEGRFEDGIRDIAATARYGRARLDERERLCREALGEPQVCTESGRDIGLAG